MILVSIVLWALGAICLFLSTSGMLRTIAELQGWARDTGDHAQAIIGGIMLGLISAGIFALASMAWSAA
jgi:hypothetical protein